MALRLLLFTLTIMLATPALAEVFRVGLLHGDADVFDYELSVLRLALANAPGNHQLEIVPLPDATQERIFSYLDSPNPPVNVFFSGYSPEREHHLLQVNIPLTRGLLGYRLLVVKGARVGELSCIDSLSDLQHYRIGSGIGWPDSEILSANDLQVVTSRYENLWRMLEAERFDLFHRGVQEVFTELTKPEHTDLSVLPGIMLQFRFDYFFYVSRHRPDLQRILQQGLLNAYNNGAFMANFESHPAIRTALDNAGLNERTIIRLVLPETYDSLDSIPARFWRRPQQALVQAPRLAGTD